MLRLACSPTARMSKANFPIQHARTLQPLRSSCTRVLFNFHVLAPDTV